LKGNQLKFKRGAAAKTEGEDRNNGGENRHHAATVRLARENLQCFSALWRFEQGQDGMASFLVQLRMPFGPAMLVTQDSQRT
jgi:hypothetical protein